MKHLVLWLTAASIFVSAGNLQAQTPWPLSVEAYLGATRGTASNDVRYRGSRSGLLADLVIGGRFHDPELPGIVAALSGTVHGVNLVRTADCRLLPDGTCMPWFPEFVTISILGGWESQGTHLRVLGGPSLASSDYTRTLGVVARIDVALPLLWHTSLMGSLNTLLVPSWKGDRFLYIAGGVGVRIR